MNRKPCANSQPEGRLLASTDLSIPQKLTLLVVLAVCISSFFLPSIFLCLRVALGIAFLTAAAFRLWCLRHVFLKCVHKDNIDLEAARHSEAEWPTYTIVLALYREAHMVPTLLNAINALDYPRDRLEILIAAEADDEATVSACLAIKGPIPLKCIYGSGDTPKTKPRALNAALQAATGDIIVIYDAEDQPHPQQLKEAAARFASGGTMLGVLQAPLRIYVDQSSTALQHQFSMDYAALFEVILPALASRGWPIPLGGSSNHFRRQALEHVGGWDPWNVTEDADIGFQLAKLGYRSELLTSPTVEIAPTTLWPWIKQRSRWIKGHMQTLKVHTHRPTDLTPAMAISLLVTLTFNLASAASTGPILCALAVFACSAGLHHQSPFVDPFHLTVLLAGWGSAVLSMGVGVRCTGAKVSVRHLMFAPLFWAFQSIAFARAAHQLWFRPYYWDKTDHVPGKGGRTGAGLDGGQGFGLSGGGDKQPPSHRA